MQELRFVLIIVGALAIAALLFHGLWTSKKEGKSKFGDKPLRKIKVESDDPPSRAFVAEDDFEIIRKERKEPDFGIPNQQHDPLISDFAPHDELDEDDEEERIPVQPQSQPQPRKVQPQVEIPRAAPNVPMTKAQPAAVTEIEVQEPQEEKLDVIVLNVHCASNQPFIGTKLFDSMQQNGLLFGEMDIFHRHADLSGTGKVLFSVANMMQPGTLMHDDPADFSTKGISFFMTLPCFGDPEQNFKLMLKTAQQIADDLGGHVLDDARNLMTPNRLDAYRKQIQEFKMGTSKASSSSFI
ncbi:cell division protein ZipA [Vibrio cholerae]|uniref:cell division protein ZipA n=1 Tax=Vibrio paracholerae TaxID=650003 RepID=UPI0004954077|nr:MULTISPECIES: cell division protein ZipA [Vibrio]MBN7278901.1 cell division protein ZipA [Vibrio paracholerae]MBN7283351.1 cell division protein ZipA [Vibrio paracholerae]PUA73277.1 cell division protein ZipA [Vibrio cholerae]